MPWSLIFVVKDLKLKIKLLSGAPLFTPNLAYFEQWDNLLNDCKAKALEMGLGMQKYFEDSDLGVALGAAAPNLTTIELGRFFNRIRLHYLVGYAMQRKGMYETAGLRASHGVSTEARILAGAMLQNECSYPQSDLFVNADLLGLLHV